VSPLELWREPRFDRSSALRHLALFYREEAANLLREASLEALASDSRSRTDTFVSESGRRRLETIGSPAWVAHRDGLLSAKFSPFERSSSVRLLAAAITGSPRPTPQALALSSLSLSPSVEATLCLAKTFLRSNDTSTVMTLLEGVLEPAIRPRDRYSALTHMASAWAIRGNTEESARCYRSAFECEPIPFAAMNWLGLSCMGGDLPSAQAASRAFDESSLGLVDIPLSVQGDLATETSQARTIARAVLEGCGDASRSYLRVFQDSKHEE